MGPVVGTEASCPWPAATAQRTGVPSRASQYSSLHFRTPSPRAQMLVSALDASSERTGRHLSVTASAQHSADTLQVPSYC